ncbi:MAG: hypothetical protein ACI4QG_07640 [Candidatus Cryptobacteroides sp.]
MNKIYKKIFFAAVCPVLCVCCSDKASVESAMQFPVSASVGISQTKVAVDAGLDLVWEQGDRVAFLAAAPDGSSAGSVLTVYAVDSGFGRAMFKGSVTMTQTPQTCHFAYPSSAVLSADGSAVFSCASQTGAHRPFLLGTAVYDATKMEVTMKQAGGMIHLLTPEGITSVTVRGNASEPLSKFAVKDGLVTFPSDALKEFSVALSGGDNYIAMPPVNFTRGFSLVFTREDGAKMFKSYSCDGGESSGFDFDEGKFVEINVPDFVETSVTASVAVSHTIDGSGILTGSSVSVSSFGFSGVTSKIVTGCGIELYVGGILAGSIEAPALSGGEILDAVSGWPYIPATLSVTLKPYCLVNGEKVYGAETPVDVPAPYFTASVSGYTSFSLYRSGDISGANAFTDASAIKGVGVSVGISADILANPACPKPQVSFATDKGKSLEATRMTGTSYTFGEWGGHPWDTSNLTATVTFDGVSVTSAPLACVITGLPYSAAPPTESGDHPWSGSGAYSFDSDMVRFGGGEGSGSCSLSFNIPESVNVAVSAKIDAYGAPVNTTSYIDVSGSRVMSCTSNSTVISYRTVTVEDTVNSTLASSNPVVTAGTTYGLGLTKGRLYYVTLKYR